jgi:hypothetical protein
VATMANFLRINQKYGILLKNTENSLTVTVVTASVKEDERGGILYTECIMWWYMYCLLYTELVPGLDFLKWPILQIHVPNKKSRVN